ncbi:uncharacterized protein An12g08210 [Aspergillus niger]|uniref:Contig An12c0270, genomic contig n=2 Tax=Aspergillus niger TaxID=5061 RepID=A2R0D3_ASPNC|nr:uncharacterized protein An12g08210 [Aspergillus niger]CAK41271.1 unnamed protein product [Aspergillus niger]
MEKNASSMQAITDWPRRLGLFVHHHFSQISFETIDFVTKPDIYVHALLLLSCSVCRPHSGRISLVSGNCTAHHHHHNRHHHHHRHQP